MAEPRGLVGMEAHRIWSEGYNVGWAEALETLPEPLITPKVTPGTVTISATGWAIENWTVEGDVTAYPLLWARDRLDEIIRAEEEHAAAGRTVRYEVGDGDLLRVDV